MKKKLKVIRTLPRSLGDCLCRQCLVSTVQNKGDWVQEQKSIMTIPLYILPVYTISLLRHFLRHILANQVFLGMVPLITKCVLVKKDSSEFIIHRPEHVQFGCVVWQTSHSLYPDPDRLWGLEPGLVVGDPFPTVKSYIPLVFFCIGYKWMSMTDGLSA